MESSCSVALRCDSCLDSQALLTSLAHKLGVPDNKVAEKNVKVVRKSFDARRERRGRPSEGPKFSYCIDVDLGAKGEAVKMKVEQGKLERTPPVESHVPPRVLGAVPVSGGGDFVDPSGGTVAVIGCGPAGLFAALRLCEAGVRVVLLERGQPVEERGRDIGAMIHRRMLQTDSK